MVTPARYFNVVSSLPEPDFDSDSKLYDNQFCARNRFLNELLVSVSALRLRGPSLYIEFSNRDKDKVLNLRDDLEEIVGGFV